MPRGVPRVEIAIYHGSKGWNWSVLCNEVVIAKGCAELKSLAWAQAYAARFEFWGREREMMEKKNH